MNKYSNSPVIENFSIIGLNGYKNIEIKTKTLAKIISAENGTGKTTILNALYGVLSGKFNYLKDINFNSISIKFHGYSEILASKEELLSSSGVKISSLPLIEKAEFLNYGLDEIELTELVEKFISDPEDIDDSRVYHKLYVSSPYTKEDIWDKLNKLVISNNIIYSKESSFKTKIQEAMQGCKVLYFPTYRRIEAEIPEFRSEIPKSRIARRVRSSRSWDSDKLINFGLSDVEDRLEYLTNDITRGTYEAYARISGRTLDQLVSVRKSLSSDPTIYDVEAIKVVFGRIGKSNSETERRVIELIESDNINKRDYDYLRYFLTQMMEVYREKQDQESAIEKFTKIVGDYWASPFSEKTFEFDKISAVASVKNKITKETIKLNKLSSGEKQIISMLAKVYLSTEENIIILIDEPELSLSMEWQRKLLPDILASQNCRQLFAITHSPFIFDNDLDEYASPLIVTYSNSYMKNTSNDE